MKRHMTRLLLAALVVGVTALAARMWFSEYDGDPDPGARFVIAGAMVRSDKSYRWVELHLRKSGGAEHDMRKPVRLTTAGGTEHEPADTTFSGNPEKGFTDIWFKFYLEDSHLEGPMTLRLNDGELRVKSNHGAPVLGPDGEAVFKSTDWGGSWLGF